MGLRLGSRKRKEKQPENEKNEKTKKDGKNKKDNDKSKALPPPVPGNLKSSENRNTSSTDTSATVQSTPGNRIVLFRDNRFPDGTTMPRVPTLQPHIAPPAADREGRISPTGSIYSTGSLQAPFPSLASYPASYVPQTNLKSFDSNSRTRGRIHSDGYYRSSYGDPLPKPDYPLSNDGTGNSNIDSGLDTESRSSSGGKPVFTSNFDSYSQQRRSPYQMYGHRSRPVSLDRSGVSYKFSEPPQILRPKGYQSNRDGPNLYQPGYSIPQRVNHYHDDYYATSATPHRWAYQKEDFEEETYRPQSTHRPIHCSSCYCAEEVPGNRRCTSSLRRIQLEDEVPIERRWDNTPRKRGRRFRRDYEEELSTRSHSGGLPRNQPLRGRYFKEMEEVDRYGRLPPVRRPISTRMSQRSFYDDNEDLNDNDDVQVDESDYSEEDESDFQETSRTYVHRKQQPDFYGTSRDIPRASIDTSVIRL